MTPEQAISSARDGKLLPVYLVLGEESHQRARVSRCLRQAALAESVPGLNEDSFSAADVNPRAVIAAARTLPMMAARRFVQVSGLERWEPKADGQKKSPLDLLAEYAQDPAPSAVLLLVAAKLDKRRRLVAQAQKAGWLVACDPLSRRALPQWVKDQARARGHGLSGALAELLAEVVGPDLALIDDALERLSLYVGEGNEITDDAVSECIHVVRPATVWELLDAVAGRHLGRTLSILGKVYDAQDRGLRLLSVLAWSTRQLLRFSAAIDEGLAPGEAAKRAGAPPFKAQKLAEQVRRLHPEELARWLPLLADADIALKGGSKRPPLAILEDLLITLCTTTGRSATGRSATGRSNGYRAKQ